MHERYQSYSKTDIFNIWMLHNEGYKEPCKPIKNFATKQNTQITTQEYHYRQADKICSSQQEDPKSLMDFNA